MNSAERSRRHRDKQRGGPPRTVVACGIGRAGAVRHRRRNEPVCVACKASEKTTNAAAYRQRKQT